MRRVEARARLLAAFLKFIYADCQFGDFGGVSDPFGTVDISGLPACSFFAGCSWACEHSGFLVPWAQGRA